MEESRSLRHFAKHLFLVSRVHLERKKAKESVSNHLKKMRKSIIRMSLSYSDVDRLKVKINNLIDWEWKYAKFFNPEDIETKLLRRLVNKLEHELKHEREGKLEIMNKNDKNIKDLTESLERIKSKMNELLIEKTKRHQKLKALDKKIGKKINTKMNHYS